ncbi:hypothetical protein [Acidovorax sp. Root267]|nr:hypothetical protein [Acidovorax sp. Root267]
MDTQQRPGGGKAQGETVIPEPHVLQAHATGAYARPQAPDG